MIRRPLRSTLFPYTTLFRSGLPVELKCKRPQLSDGNHGNHWARVGQERLIGCPDAGPHDIPAISVITVGERSEEHTSELQSLRHLVCRLLLEKKKNKKINQT